MPWSGNAKLQRAAERSLTPGCWSDLVRVGSTVEKTQSFSGVALPASLVEKLPLHRDDNTASRVRRFIRNNLQMGEANFELLCPEGSAWITGLRPLSRSWPSPSIDPISPHPRPQFIRPFPLREKVVEAFQRGCVLARVALSCVVPITDGTHRLNQLAFDLLF